MSNLNDIPHGNPIEEARRYLADAKELLSKKAKKRGRFYNDPKYVRMAGDTAWHGVFIALEATFGMSKKKKKGRLDVNDYKTAVKARNKTIGRVVDSAYNYLHLFMGYDGDLNLTTAQEGLRQAHEIVDWCEKIYKR